MKENSHTPGPWTTSTVDPASVLGTERQVIAAANLDDAGDYSTAFANARLIAAAPELLACLLDVLDADGDLNVMDFNRYRAALALMLLAATLTGCAPAPRAAPVRLHILETHEAPELAAMRCALGSDGTDLSIVKCYEVYDATMPEPL